MTTEQLNGVKLLKWGNGLVAWFDTALQPQVSELIESKSVRGVCVSRHQGYVETNLDRLHELPPFEWLIVPDPQGFDLSGLTRLAGLKLLSVGEGKRSPLRFQDLTHLEDLSLTCTVGDVLPAPTSGLRRLLLRKYKGRNSNLADLPAYEDLTILELVQAQVKTLEGVGRLRRLQSIDIAHCKTLELVGALLESPVESVHIESCKRISDVAMLATQPTIKKLVVSGLSPLPSIQFISVMPSLEEFRFVNTEILDGDLRPLLGLKRVGFLNRRGLSHTVEQVQALIESRSTGT